MASSPPFSFCCGIGSWGRQCPSLAD